MLKIQSEGNESESSGDLGISLSCDKISKDFFIIDEKLNWRLVFSQKKFLNRAFRALDDISITVPKGKFVGVLGRNGAGKSTLLRTVGGVYHPDSGLVRLSGKPSALFEMGGFGSRALTGAAYADRFLEINGIRSHERSLLIPRIKAFSELEDYFERPLYTYSSGMAARLYFSTATEVQHKIYLVDELLSVGDEHFQTKCWRRLKERFTAGASGLLVTHDWSAVLKLCEMSCILDKGRLVAMGESPKIVQQYLSLPVPAKEFAEIIPNPQPVTVISGQDCVIHFEVLVKKPVRFAINYSIEIFRAGFGWEIILMNPDYINPDCQLGLNACVIAIKRLPLAAGEYNLNIFLKSLEETIDSSRLDACSWTHGNGIKFRVTGAESTAVLNLPWQKHSRQIDHVL